jgi:aldoxime dehydratase
VTVESAIPPHLTVERTRPRRVPDGYAPPYPSYVARNAQSVDKVVMAYLGLQPVGDPPSLDALDAALAADDGPGHHDRATGDGEIVTAAYWSDLAAFDRWWAAHRDSWLGDDVRDGHGRWAEIIRPRVEEHETLFSSLGRPEGVAVLAEGLSGEIVEHAYWGGMRDRIPLSQNDPMLGVGAPLVEEDAGRVRVRPPEGLCLIRSGQDWTDTDGDERGMYLNDVEPVLRAGMEFLRDEGAPIGCYANRYVTVDGANAATG